MRKIFRKTCICFSYHELGIYDLPAMIDYVLYMTGHERMYYGGHSEGTTQFWVMASEKPEYNSKIILMIGLAPAAFSGNIRGPIKKLAKLTYIGVVRESSLKHWLRDRVNSRRQSLLFLLQWVGETFGYPELRSRSEWGKFVSNLFCQKTASTQFICSNILFLVIGFSRAELNTVRINDMRSIPCNAFSFLFVLLIEFPAIGKPDGHHKPRTRWSFLETTRALRSRIYQCR